ncbi:MAG: HTH-type transcriptional regulator betI [Actinomycetia bacterium]|nr:HTH-type transcriptional regulator betI [Actinomycetes bacterium]
MDVRHAGPAGLRERTRRAVRADIADAAMRLFLEQGFEATTIDQISKEVGISPRSLFRHFGTKEDIVLGNLTEAGQAVKTALEARPADEAPWDALRAAFEVLAADPAYLSGQSLKISKMFYETPSLRACQLEKRLRWLELLVPNIETRLGADTGTGPGHRARALVACALACLDTATEAWVLSNGQVDLAQIFDEAVAAVRS